MENKQHSPKRDYTKDYKSRLEKYSVEGLIEILIKGKLWDYQFPGSVGAERNAREYPLIYEEINRRVIKCPPTTGKD